MAASLASFGASARGGLKATLLALAIFGLAACETTSEPAPPPRAVYVPPVQPQAVQELQGWHERAEFVRPVHMQGRTPVRVALLLPFSHSSSQAREIAASMRSAAELAVFRSGRSDILLLPKDTHGTTGGAISAANEAIAEGAEIILGPLFADNVDAITPIVQRAGLSMVAFSSDSQVADRDVYLLSFTPEQEVSRVAEYALSQGYFNFAAMIPLTDYGTRVQLSFEDTVSRYGGSLVHTVYYDQGADDFRSQARELAGTYGVRHLRRTDEDGNELGAESLVPTEPGFRAVLLPEGGTTLRLLAPSLPYNDIDNRVVRFLGTGLWDNPLLWREPALDYGWFAAPAPETRGRFVAAYQAAFGNNPHRLASLAYDAVTLTASLANGIPGERFTAARLTNPSGFAGVDGIFRFNANGNTERGLAVMQVRNGEVMEVSPPPLRFGPADAVTRERPISSLDTESKPAG